MICVWSPRLRVSTDHRPTTLIRTLVTFWQGNICIFNVDDKGIGSDLIWQALTLSRDLLYMTDVTVGWFLTLKATTPTALLFCYHTTRWYLCPCECWVSDEAVSALLVPVICQSTDLLHNRQFNLSSLFMITIMMAVLFSSVPVSHECDSEPSRPFSTVTSQRASVKIAFIFVTLENDEAQRFLTSTPTFTPAPDSFIKPWVFVESIPVYF